MKKNFLSVLLLFIAFTASAQKGKFEYGFQGGINLNKAYGNALDKASLKSSTGLSIGVNAKYALSKQFGIKAQLSFEQFGWANRALYFADSTGNLVKGDVIFKLNYINLPLMVEYSFGRKIKFLLSAGGFTGILVSNKVEVKQATSGISQQPVNYSFTSDSRSKVNAGLAAGVGIQIPLTSKISLDVNAKNYVGLTNVNKSVSGYNSSIKTLTYSFLSGLTFRL